MRSQFRSIGVMAVVALAMAACNDGSPSPPAPTVTLTSSASDVSIASAPPVTLNWWSTHAASCTASGAWSGPLGPSGSQNIVVPQTSVYTISCSGRGGVATASVTIHAWVPPSVSLTADRESVLPNETVLLTWSSQNATECFGFSGLPGSMPSLPTAGSQVTAPLTQNTRFQVVCSNPVLRAAIAQVVVEVAPQRFVAFELPMNSAVDLNDLGDVVGTRHRDGYPYEAVAWMAGAVEVLGYSVPPYEMDSFSPVAINSSRTVIGRWSPALSVMTFSVFRWNVGVGLELAVGLDAPIKLPIQSSFNDINDAGQIVGRAPGSGAMLYSGGTVFPLFDSTDPFHYPNAINGLGHIAGDFVSGADGIVHVFMYTDGAVQDLGTLDGSDSYAYDINMFDQIVGAAGSAASTRAILYANSKFTDLGSLGGASSWATGVNDAGKIVGSSTLAGPDPQERRAFLYVNGRMFDLNELIDSLPWPLTSAPKINNRGQIIANGCPPQRAPPQYGRPSDCRAYLLTPVPLQ